MLKVVEISAKQYSTSYCENSDIKQLRSYTMNKRNIITATLIALSISACTSKLELQLGFEPGSCVFDKESQPAPDWFCAPHELFPEGSWYEKGVGHTSLNDNNLQYTVAIQNARTELSRRASTHVEESFKTRTTTDGSPDAQHAEIARDIISKLSTDVVLPPTHKHAEIYDSQGNLYVLVKVDEKLLLANVNKKEDMLMREFNAELKRKGLLKVEQQISATKSEKKAEPNKITGK
jgi:hypothetical protein